ncbi:uncharacterized mitochondrial protein AtMg00300-like [Malania oleifera]|uniref:uncharacterized mitochondrial protein AtMg00300-like n=1 Tax=Malania oleifera TaxID=397392 RepID=UPI0025AE87C3|nr:uncharacterized mitochondrial protein AtMg00300-like [Malania oleifera]
MKVCKGALMMMNGHKLDGNIYALFGTTIVGGATAIDFEFDDTILRHMRLGHINEHDMKELHKRKLLKGMKTCKLNFCKFCVLGKRNMVQFKEVMHKMEDILDYIHFNVWGLMRAASWVFWPHKLCFSVGPISPNELCSFDGQFSGLTFFARQLG